MWFRPCGIKMFFVLVMSRDYSKNNFVLFERVVLNAMNFFCCVLCVWGGGWDTIFQHGTHSAISKIIAIA